MILENSGGEQYVVMRAKSDIDTVFDRQLKKGMDKYGTQLKTFNGRNPGEDAMEEAIDLVVYLRQIRTERDALMELLFLYTTPDSLPEKIEATLVKHVEDNKLDIETLKKKWGLQ